MIFFMYYFCLFINLMNNNYDVSILKSDSESSEVPFEDLLYNL